MHRQSADISSRERDAKFDKQYRTEKGGAASIIAMPMFSVRKQECMKFTHSRQNVSVRQTPSNGEATTVVFSAVIQVMDEMQKSVSA